MKKLHLLVYLNAYIEYYINIVIQNGANIKSATFADGITITLQNLSLCNLNFDNPNINLYIIGCHCCNIIACCPIRVDFCSNCKFRSVNNFILLNNCDVCISEMHNIEKVNNTLSNCYFCLAHN